MAWSLYARPGATTKHRDAGPSAARYVRGDVLTGLRRAPDRSLRARGGTRLRALEEWLSLRESGRRPAALPSRDGTGRFVTTGVGATAIS
jgi:hypothetical protein